MKTALVLGSKGFLARNLIEGLQRLKDCKILEFDIDSPENELKDHLSKADIVFNLAGVNRPKDDKEFEKGNTLFTKTVVDIIEGVKRYPPIVLSSSIQAELNNPYGSSKKKAEEILVRYSKDHKTKVHIYRLSNVFGKWSKPNYNSVVATFCYNISHNLPINIADESKKVPLLYIDDVVNEFTCILTGTDRDINKYYYSIEKVHPVTLGELARLIKSFAEMRKNLILPDFSDEFTKTLYATYLSFLEKTDFAYGLEVKTDNRGGLFEFIKSRSSGQIFISKTKKGIRRGNHYHNTKTEKFCVIKGKAIIKFRNIFSSEVISYPVSGDDIKVVDIPPGYTHSIENAGDDELITLFWADEIFDPDNTDTYFLEV